jgi:hypothetical protein
VVVVKFNVVPVSFGCLVICEKLEVFFVKFLDFRVDCYEV